jgi:UDP-2,4-diacetamido-2,4,6-trideoxy-beta-L-altropyranose hydrolase
MRIVFRADAGAEIGTGHIMRCLALAQAWHDAGGSSIFASVTCPPGLADRLRCEGSALETIAAEPGSGEDAEQTARVAAREAADWLVLDGYRFDDAFEDSIRTGGARVCAFDDYGHALHSAADLIVNQNEYARAEEYGGRGASDRLLLGSRYAALRREFRRYRDWRRDDPQTASRVLVSLGGAVPDNATAEIVEALDDVDLPGLEARIIAGASNDHHADLCALASRLSANVEIARDVRNISELMAWAHVAVGAGGTSTWERAFMGLPSLVLVLASNQTRIAERVERLGLGRRVDSERGSRRAAIAEALRKLMESPQARAEMSRRGRELVDGEGCDRLVQRLRSGAKKE